MLGLAYLIIALKARTNVVFWSSVTKLCQQRGSFFSHLNNDREYSARKLYAAFWSLRVAVSPKGSPILYKHTEVLIGTKI